MKKRLQLKIFGRVQGVGFRYFILRTANSLKVNGYVRNLNNNSVEVWAEGEEDKLILLLEMAKKGPSFARVDDIKIDWSNELENYKEFKII